MCFRARFISPCSNHLIGRPLDYGIKDYDLGYFDASDISYEAEDAVIRRVKAVFEEPLRSMVEVRNQARVHLWFEAKFGEAYGPLSCTAEALERFASATFAVGVRFETDDRLQIEAPSVLPICLHCACGPILAARRSALPGLLRMCDAAGLKSSLRTNHRSGLGMALSKSPPAALYGCWGDISTRDGFRGKAEP